VFIPFLVCAFICHRSDPVFPTLIFRCRKISFSCSGLRPLVGSRSEFLFPVFGARGLIFLSFYPSHGRTAPGLGFGFVPPASVSALGSWFQRQGFAAAVFLFLASDLSTPIFAALLLLRSRGSCRRPSVGFLSSRVSPLVVFS
jgi:hypothetical protein